jgi:hypothetical protein
MRLVSAATGVGEAHDRLGCCDRTDAAPVGQPGRQIVHDGLQLRAIVLECAVPPRNLRFSASADVAEEHLHLPAWLSRVRLPWEGITAGAVLAEMLQVVDAVRNWSAHFLRRS